MDFFCRGFIEELVIFLNIMIISTNNLKRNFQVGSETVEALKDINLSVEKGEFVSIMGPSGSGKTTLMNIIGCLDTPTHGTYHLNNQLVNNLNDDDLALIRNKEIGFVFQSFHLLAKNSALNNVMLPMKYAGVKESEAKSRAMDVLEKVGLTNRANHAPTACVGEEITCPTSTGLDIIVPSTGDLTIVSSSAILAFSNVTSVLTTVDFA